MQNAIATAQADHPDDPTNPHGVEVQLRSTATKLIDDAGALRIFTAADLSYATDLLKSLTERGKQAEEERKRLVKPFNDGVAQINARFKSITLPLQDAVGMLKDKMLTFQRAAERKAEEERQRRQREQDEIDRKERERKAAEEAQNLKEATDGEEQDRAAPPARIEEPPPPAVASSFKPSTYGQTGAISTVKKVWKHELADISQVPAQYLLLDTVKVNQAVRAGIREIPGVRIFQTEELAVK